MEHESSSRMLSSSSSSSSSFSGKRKRTQKQRNPTKNRQERQQPPDYVRQSGAALKYRGSSNSAGSTKRSKNRKNRCREDDRRTNREQEEEPWQASSSIPSSMSSSLSMTPEACATMSSQENSDNDVDNMASYDSDICHHGSNRNHFSGKKQPSKSKQQQPQLQDESQLSFATTEIEEKPSLLHQSTNIRIKRPCKKLTAAKTSTATKTVSGDYEDNTSPNVAGNWIKATTTTTTMAATNATVRNGRNTGGYRRRRVAPGRRRGAALDNTVLGSKKQRIESIFGDGSDSDCHASERASAPDEHSNENRKTTSSRRALNRWNQVPGKTRATKPCTPTTKLAGVKDVTSNVVMNGDTSMSGMGSLTDTDIEMEIPKRPHQHHKCVATGNLQRAAKGTTHTTRRISTNGKKKPKRSHVVDDSKSSSDSELEITLPRRSKDGLATSNSKVKKKSTTDAGDSGNAATKDHGHCSKYNYDGDDDEEVQDDDSDEEMEIPYAQRLGLPGESQVIMAAELCEAKKEPLRPGDVIMYSNPVFVAGTSQALRITQVLNTDPNAEEFPLTLDNGEFLPTDTCIKRIQEYVQTKGNLLNHRGIFRPIENFVIKKRSLGSRDQGALTGFREKAAKLHAAFLEGKTVKTIPEKFSAQESSDNDDSCRSSSSISSNDEDDYNKEKMLSMARGFVSNAKKNAACSSPNSDSSSLQLRPFQASRGQERTHRVTTSKQKRTANDFLSSEDEQSNPNSPITGHVKRRAQSKKEVASNIAASTPRNSCVRKDNKSILSLSKVNDFSSLPGRDLLPSKQCASNEPGPIRCSNSRIGISSKRGWQTSRRGNKKAPPITSTAKNQRNENIAAYSRVNRAPSLYTSAIQNCKEPFSDSMLAGSRKQTFGKLPPEDPILDDSFDDRFDTIHDSIDLTNSCSDDDDGKSLLGSVARRQKQPKKNSHPADLSLESKLKKNSISKRKTHTFAQGRESSFRSKAQLEDFDEDYHDFGLVDSSDEDNENSFARRSFKHPVESAASSSHKTDEISSFRSSQSSLQSGKKRFKSKTPCVARTHRNNCPSSRSTSRSGSARRRTSPVPTLPMQLSLQSVPRSQPRLL